MKARKFENTDRQINSTSLYLFQPPITTGSKAVPSEHAINGRPHSPAPDYDVHTLKADKTPPGRISDLKEVTIVEHSPPSKVTSIFPPQIGSYITLKYCFTKS